LSRPRFIAFLFAALIIISYGGLRASAEEPVGGDMYAGATECKNCHEARFEVFDHGIHGTSGYFDKSFIGCESCHGPGVMHVVAGGDKTKIIGPSTWTQAQATGFCLNCHVKTPRLKYWEGSIHQRAGLMCHDCHKVSFARATLDKLLFKGTSQADACLRCHTEIRIALSQRSRHPLRDSSRPDSEGNMVCTDCHNPHGTVADHLIDANSINDKCWQCHMEKKMPVLWEHPPVKENCLNCHTPHGSGNRSLLAQPESFLCFSCHPQGHTGSVNNRWAVSRGCLNCHSMIHGSNNPSGVMLGQ
jgi:DmsE family decaheme c-type cytochrome